MTVDVIAVILPIRFHVVLHFGTAMNVSVAVTMGGGENAGGVQSRWFDVCLGGVFFAFAKGQVDHGGCCDVGILIIANAVVGDLAV